MSDETKTPATPAAPTPPAAPIKLYLKQDVLFGGKTIKKGEVLAEIIVHPDSVLHHVVGVMRNGLVSPEKPVDEEAKK